MNRQPSSRLLAFAIVAQLIACGSPSTSTPESNGNDGGTAQVGVSCPGAPPPATRPKDGTPLPPEIAAKYVLAGNALGDAMAANDADAVAARVCDARALLGAFQGVAEAAAAYGTRRSDPIAATTMAAPYLATLDSALGHELWTQVGETTHGAPLSFPLRAPCLEARYLLAASTFGGSRAAEYVASAKTGLAWLMSLQRSDGFFPFPDLSDDYQAFLASCTAKGGSPSQCESEEPRLFMLAARAKTAWMASGSPPDMLVDGWWVKDPGAGEFNFDTGECGRALLDGYEALGDSSYLAAARRAGVWAKSQRSVPNFNYNAFLVGLLARLERADGGSKERWGESALAHARIGVLPGALPDGRWFDPHNAKIVYHHIILRDLADLATVVRDPVVDATLAAAHQRSVDELSTQGSAGLDDGILAHVTARRLGVGSDLGLRVLVQGSFEGGAVRTGGLAFFIADELSKK